MSKKKNDSNLSIEERLEQALIPNWDEPYKLPDNWCWCMVGTICEIVNGYAFKSNKFLTDSGVPVVRIANISEGFVDIKDCIYTSEMVDDRFVVEHGDLLIAMSGATTGKNGVYNYMDKAFLNQRVGNVRVKYPELLFDRFRNYYFINIQQEILNLAYGGAQPNISAEKIAQMVFPLPPYSEQQRIVERIESLFTKLDEAKEKAQEVLDGFETRKAAILHKAFSGELTVKWRKENNILMEEWEHHKISDLCKIVRGGSPRPAGSPEFYGGDIPFMKVADITKITTPYVETTEHFIKPAGLRKTRLVKANTLLLTNSGATLGVPAICTFETTFNDGIAAFLGLDPETLLFYYYFWTMKTPDLRAINKGAAQPNLNTDIIGAVELDVPTVSEQKVIVELLESLIYKEQKAKEIAEDIVEKIDIMKKAILSKAFRGELGTNDTDEENAQKLLKSVISGEPTSNKETKSISRKVMIPPEMKSLLSNACEEEIMKVFLKFAPQEVHVQEIMALSSKKFEIMDCLRSLEKKQLIQKNDEGKYLLKR